MAKTKKKESKRRLLLLILLLVCAIVLLGSATYAWFTANTKVAIEAMDLEVTVANGIEISADAKNWGAMLSIDDLYAAAGMNVAGSKSIHEDAGSVNQFPEKLKNVSSIGNISDANRLELFNGVASSVCYTAESPDKLVGVISDYYTKEEGGVDITDCVGDIPLGLVKTSDYQEGNVACGHKAGVSCSATDGNGVVAFDIYFKLENNSDVYIDPQSYLKNTTDTDYGLKNTMRMAFVVLGTQPSDYYYANDDHIDADGKVQGLSSVVRDEDYESQFGGYAGVYGARQMNGFGSITIWEPNAADHRKGGRDNAINNYGVAESDLNTPLVTNGLFKSIDSDDLPLKLEDTTPTNEIGKKYFDAQTTVATAAGNYKNAVTYAKSDGETLNVSGTGKQKLFTGKKGVTKVRVYMWVEGNDVDTENNATSSKIQALLSFTTSGSSENITNSSTITYTRTTVENNWRNDVDVSVKTPVGGTYTGTSSTPAEEPGSETSE